MKLNRNFVTQNVGDTQFMVATGSESFSGMVRSNRSAAFIIDSLRYETTKEEIVEKMLENDAYCPDILTQVSAINSALNSFNKELLASHMKSCVINDIRAGKDEAIDELVATLQKIMK